MSPPAAKSPYAGYRFPAEVISHAVWLYFRFPMSLRMMEEMLAARGIVVSHETVRQWARKFGQDFAIGLRLGRRDHNLCGLHPCGETTIAGAALGGDPGGADPV